jgi:hypothetical protein
MELLKKMKQKVDGYLLDANNCIYYSNAKNRQKDARLQKKESPND